MEKCINGTSISLINKWIDLVLLKIKERKLYVTEQSDDVVMDKETIAILKIMCNILSPNMDEQGHSETYFSLRVSKVLKGWNTRAIKEYLLLFRKIISYK